jgi:signal transduction histidine kinase
VGPGSGSPSFGRSIERLDGRIEVDSEVGRGSVLTMTMPIAAEDLPARRQATG